MGETIRILLLLGIAGALVTLLGSAAAYFRDEDRRMRRMLKRALQGPPEMVVIATGYGMGAGLNTARRKVAVLWDGGDKGLIYRLEQLVGGELIVDDRVAARAFRGEARRALDEISGEAKRVLLRLVFDNPRDPDFELVLWPPSDPAKLQQGSALQAVQTGRRWVSSVEAILRQPMAVAAAPFGNPASVTPPKAPHPQDDGDQPDLPWDEDEDD